MLTKISLLLSLSLSRAVSTAAAETARTPPPSIASLQPGFRVLPPPRPVRPQDCCWSGRHPSLYQVVDYTKHLLRVPNITTNGTVKGVGSAPPPAWLVAPIGATYPTLGARAVGAVVGAPLSVQKSDAREKFRRNRQPARQPNETMIRRCAEHAPSRRQSALNEFPSGFGGTSVVSAGQGSCLFMTFYGVRQGSWRKDRR